MVLEIAQFLPVKKVSQPEMRTQTLLKKSGPRVVGETSRKAMEQVLKEIQDGTFANKFLTENRAAGWANFYAMRRINADHQIEQVGAKLRGMMSWLKDGADLSKD